MGSIVVFAMGLAAMFASVLLIWRLRDTERPAPLALDMAAPVGSRIAAVVQRSTGMLTAAAVAGLLVPGMGGRLMMRLLAATSPESAQGRLTDAEEVVGRVTFGGTVFLVLFVGLFGGLISLGIFVLVRRWLPQRSIAAGVVVAALGAGLFIRPSGFLHPGNRDFAILSPAWLAVLCAVVILGVYGMLFTVLVDSWASTWPANNHSKWGVVAALSFVVMLGISALGIVPGDKPHLDDSRITRTEPIGRKFMSALAAAGAVWVLVSAVEILRL